LAHGTGGNAAGQGTKLSSGEWFHFRDPYELKDVFHM
jgi:hypothetical protein